MTTQQDQHGQHERPDHRDGEAHRDHDPQQDDERREEGEPHPHRWRALAVCLVSGFMTLLDVSIVNVALPSIRSDLAASASDLQWVVSGYALTFGLVLVPAGRLADVVGRRRVFVGGLLLFTLASLGCGLAPGATWLLLARLLQGAGGGMLQPQVAAFITSLFSGPERGRAFGYLGTVIGLSTAVGPLLGGTILSVDPQPSAWRLIFFINLPIGIAGVVLALRWLPEVASGRGSVRHLDWVGVGLLAVAIATLLLPILEQPSAWVWVALWAVAAVAGTAFFAWERRRNRRDAPAVVDLSLFRTPRYRNGVSLGLLYFTGFTTIFFVLSIYLQTGLGMSPLQAGLTQTPFAVGAAVTPSIAGRYVDRLGRKLVVGGLTVVVVGLTGVLLVIGLLGSGLGPWHLGLVLLVPLLVAGAGSGLSISPNVTLTMSVVDPARSGSASGVLQTAQRIGSSIGIAVVGAVFFAAVGQDSWDRGLVVGLSVAAGLVALSLVPALLDLRAEHRGVAAEG